MDAVALLPSKEGLNLPQMPPKSSCRVGKEHEPFPGSHEWNTKGKTMQAKPNHTYVLRIWQESPYWHASLTEVLLSGQHTYKQLMFKSPQKLLEFLQQLSPPPRAKARASEHYH